MKQASYINIFVIVNISIQGIAGLPGPIGLDGVAGLHGYKGEKVRALECPSIFLVWTLHGAQLIVGQKSSLLIDIIPLGKNIGISVF